MNADRISTILVVDDAPNNISVISELLAERYRIKVATNGERALQICANDPPDLILLDIMMPGIDGYEVCRQLKQDHKTADIPIIFLTAKSEIDDERRGLNMGAVDYITKPISPPLLLARVDTQLRLKAVADFFKNENKYLEQEIKRRTHDIEAIQEVTIVMMASLAETRDQETGNHIARTQHYVRLLAEYLAAQRRHAADLDAYTIEMMFKSAPLHDIGKVGIPDSVLLKPGKLNDKEWEIMKTHAKIGKDSIEHAEDLLGRPVDFLRFAKEIAYSHHEKWDGSGYPQQLAGEQIPLSARLMALADVYDALRSRRVYKAAMSADDAATIILQGRGNHFDPDVVDAFVNCQSEFTAIANRFVDDAMVG